MTRLNTRWIAEKRKWQISVSKDSNEFTDLEIKTVGEHGKTMSKDPEKDGRSPFEQVQQTIEDIRERIYDHPSYIKFIKRYGKNLKNVLTNQRFFPQIPLTENIRETGRNVKQTLSQHLDTSRITNIGPATIAFLSATLLAIFGYMKYFTNPGESLSSLKSFVPEVKNKTLKEVSQRFEDIYNATTGGNLTRDAFDFMLNTEFEKTIDLSTNYYNEKLNETDIQFQASNSSNSSVLTTILVITLITTVLSSCFYCYNVYEKKQKQEYDILKNLLERLSDIEKEIKLKEQATQSLINFLLPNFANNCYWEDTILETLEKKIDLTQYGELHNRLSHLDENQSKQLKRDLYELPFTQELILEAKKIHAEEKKKQNITPKNDDELNDLLKNNEKLRYINTLMTISTSASQDLSKFVSSSLEESMKYLLKANAPSLNDNNTSTPIIVPPAENVQKTVAKTISQLTGLKYEKIPGNGHCLFTAVGLYLGQDQSSLRPMVAEHIEKNSNQFIQFLALPPGKTIEDYLQDVRNGEEWADHIEIEVLMRVLGRPILIIDPNGNLRNTGDANRFKGEPIFVYYNDRDHYDALLLSQGATGRNVLNAITSRSAKKLAPQQPLTQLSEHSPPALSRKGLSAKGKLNHQQLIQTLPQDKTWDFGRAKDNNDCFYDAIAQSLHASTANGTHTVKSLRKMCSDYIHRLNTQSLQANWVKTAIEKDIEKSYGIDDYEAHLTTVQYTQEEMAKFKQESNAFTGYAIWGKYYIEGKILARQLNISLHIIEFHEAEGGMEAISSAHILVTRDKVSQVEEKSSYYQDKQMLHLAVYRNHFVPILPSHYLKQQQSNPEGREQEMTYSGKEEEEDSTPQSPPSLT